MSRISTCVNHMKTEHRLNENRPGTTHTMMFPPINRSSGVTSLTYVLDKKILLVTPSTCTRIGHARCSKMWKSHSPPLGAIIACLVPCLRSMHRQPVSESSHIWKDNGYRCSPSNGNDWWLPCSSCLHCSPESQHTRRPTSYAFPMNGCGCSSWGLQQQGPMGRKTVKNYYCVL